MTYDLGQIIYVLSNKTQTIVPAVIEEEFVHKKLNGNVVNYKVSIGPPGKKKIVDLEKIDGEVFTDLESIRNTLVERLTGFVNDLIVSTENRTKQWYGNGGSQSPTVAENKGSSNDKIDPQTFIEQANVPVQQSKQQVPTSNRQVAREHLRSLVDPGDQMVDPGEEMEMIDEDGKVKKVKLNLNGN